MIVLTTGAGALCALISDRRGGRFSFAAAKPTERPSGSRDSGRSGRVANSARRADRGADPV